METKTIKFLRELADKYETPEFIANDPIQIPHRYTDKRDIEISAFVTSWISWGNRTSIIKTADFIDGQIFNHRPYDFIMNIRNFEDFQNDERKIYRTFAYAGFYDLCYMLHGIYSCNKDMEEYMDDAQYDLALHHPVLVLSDYFHGIKGIPYYENKSSCKRLNMFLRWMCRKNSSVDFGVWDYDPKDLIVPVDIHVLRTARKLGLTKKNNPTFNVAVEITDAMKEVFPNDPCRGDFALFGAGIYKESLV